MNNRMTNFLTARDSKWNLAGGILVLLMLILGCSDSGNTAPETAKKPIPPAYIGKWTAADSSTLTIRSDSTGDYKFGGKSVDGGAVEVDEAAKEIRFTMLGFDAGKYKIEQSPANNKMTLDGMEYRRTGGFDRGSKDTTSGNSTGEVPSESELRPVAVETLKSFNDAVQKGDFSDFYAEISETWQSQTTAGEMTEAFKPLYNKKYDFTPKDTTALKFAPPPAFESDNVLKAETMYQTVKGSNERFRLRYVKEGGNWKLLGIRLNP